MYNGGKYIASGIYGCTFYPHLKCIDVSNKKNTVGKVFSDTNDYELELDIMKQIKKDIDPTNKFTVPFHESCGVHYYRKTDEASTCLHLDQENPRLHKQILYGYGGKALSNKLTTTGNIKGFLGMLPHFIPIFEGLVKFNQYKIVHLDIKTDNILMLKSKLFIIDFGMMQSEKEIYTKNNLRVLLHDCSWYPPEFKVFLYKNNNGFENLFKRVSDNFQGSSQIIAKSMATVLKMKSKDDLQRFFTDDVPKKDFKQYASKIDVYSIGIVIFKLYLWSGFHKKSYKRKTKNVVIREHLVDMIQNMICFDPRNRMTSQEALDKLKVVCSMIAKS
jgi:serine/threonine protein kinase